jgi:hypothetical protein
MTDKLFDSIDRALKQKLIHNYYVHEGILFVEFLTDTTNEQRVALREHVTEKYGLDATLHKTYLQIAFASHKHYVASQYI